MVVSSEDKKKYSTFELGMRNWPACELSKLTVADAQINFGRNYFSSYLMFGEGRSVKRLLAKNKDCKASDSLPF